MNSLFKLKSNGLKAARTTHTSIPDIKCIVNDNINTLAFCLAVEEWKNSFFFPRRLYAREVEWKHVSDACMHNGIPVSKYITLYFIY